MCICIVSKISLSGDNKTQRRNSVNCEKYIFLTACIRPSVRCGEKEVVKVSVSTNFRMELIDPSDREVSIF